MPQYRRAKTKGGSYFFTIVTYRRQVLFKEKSTIDQLRHAIQQVKYTHPFIIDAWVLLPDHMHCLWTLPKDDCDYAKRIGLIKAKFTQHMRAVLQKSEWLTASKRSRKESTIWQKRFWEHEIRDERDYQQHLDYIHFNPVKHGWVQRVVDWPYSTFHRYVKQGIYPNDWAGDDVVESGEYGE